ncbi:MAG: glycosyltransferase [Niabella sp.]
MLLVKIIWGLIQVGAGIYFIFPFVLKLISAIKAKAAKSVNTDGYEYDYAVIVTAYQQADLLPDVVNSILNADYSNYLIYIVADNCDTVPFNFTSDKVILLQPPQVLSSNTRSHKYAIESFKREHEIITIIDSDNIIDAGYFKNLNRLFHRGYKAVQGVRAARNLNTVYARLDEAGDIFYRYIDRKLLFEAGSSASLAGSGMAFISDLYKKFLFDFSVSGAGFDKVLQYELVKSNEIIAFAEDAVVYDGKTSKSDQLVKQRARWINTWFRYWLLALRLFTRSVIKLNWNQFAFSIMLLRPPLFILFFITITLIAVNIFIYPSMLFFWLIALFLFFYTFRASLVYFKADQNIYKSLLQAPKFIFFQVIALLKARKANKLSVATKHDTDIYKPE